MKKLFRKFNIKAIEVFVYKMDYVKSLNVNDLSFKIDVQQINNDKKRYYIEDNGILVHDSFLYEKVYLLRLINKKGPVIGSCFTNIKYRGQSIYPYVINRIAVDELNSGKKEVFMIVDQDNISSIKGIEKAGFEKLVSIKTKRWLWFYFNKVIIWN